MTGAEWVAPLVASAVVAAMGWLIVNKLNRIDTKLDRYEERQAKIEKDCVTWEDLESLRKTDIEHDRRITVVETRCAEHHKEQ